MTPFWPEEPEMWFEQLECQFALAGITVDSTKYNHLMCSLDYKYVREIRDVIKKLPATGKYEKVKAELIGRLSSSQEQRVRQLLSHEDIGDRKPSQFLRHLQSLAGPDVPDDFVRSLWESRLPTHVQMIVASQPRSALDELATLADTVNNVIGRTPQVHQLSASGSQNRIAVSTPPTPHSEFDDLKKAISELTLQVAALSSSPRYCGRSRRRSGERSYERYRHRSLSRSRTRDEVSKGYCWYHYKFRDKATKCRSPCSFAENSNDGR